MDSLLLKILPLLLQPDNLQLCKPWNFYIDVDLNNTIFWFCNFDSNLALCQSRSDTCISSFQGISLLSFYQLLSIDNGSFMKCMIQDTYQNQLDMLVLRFCIIQTKPKCLVVRRHISLCVKFLVVYQTMFYCKMLHPLSIFKLLDSNYAVS